MSCSAWPDPCSREMASMELCRAMGVGLSQAASGNFFLRKKRMKHYFLEWSLCHAFTHISCGLSAKELGIHSTVSCRGVHLFSLESEGVGCLRTCFRLLVLCREVQLIWDIGRTCENDIFLASNYLSPLDFEGNVTKCCLLEQYYFLQWSKKTLNTTKDKQFIFVHFGSCCPNPFLHYYFILNFNCTNV